MKLLKVENITNERIEGFYTKLQGTCFSNLKIMVFNHSRHTNLKFRRYRTRVQVVHGRVKLGDMLVSNASHTLSVITVRCSDIQARKLL